MEAEIFLTLISSEGTPSLPMNVKRVEDKNGFRIIEYYGRDELEKGYEGIIRLELNLIPQKISTYYFDHSDSKGDKKSKVEISGAFEDDKYSVFEGEWHEAGIKYHLGIYGM